LKTFRKDIFYTIPEDADFWITVWSSGWCSLEPFSTDEEKRTLSRVQRLTGGKIVKITISDKQKDILIIEVESGHELGEMDVEEVEDIVETCLRFDEDLTSFFELLEGYPEFRWVKEMGAGRSVRSPTVFEDVVKTICSTNCSWALTKATSRRLCGKLGEPFTDGSYTFPTPVQMASTTEEFMRAEIKAGYRSPYLIDLSRKIVEGELDVEAWKNSPLDSTSLKNEIMKIKGVGDYAADHILKLLDRYDFLALDSWSRKRFSQIHNDGEQASDEEIEEFYAPFGKWKGLLIWLDLAREYIIPKKSNS